MAKSTSLLASPKPQQSQTDLRLDFGPTVYKFVLATATGKTETGATAREVACFGTRGDGKTQGALGAMVAHAQLHQRAGYPLPAKWLGVTDTFASHKNKTIESLNNPMWQGLWTLRDGGHVAVFGHGSCELVHLHLFGIEDQGAMDRVRTETVGVWFEEPAPTALLVQSSGVNEMAWATAITSQRIPSHHHPAIMTLNYPDEDHWTWQRFVAEPHENSAYYRVPPGERASAQQRAEWMRALDGRPDLQRRLLQGQPGVVMLGQQVAIGFSEDIHVARQRLQVIRNEPLFMGQDGGHTPCTVIGQEWRGQLRVYAALPMDRGGMRQQYERNVLPWLTQNAPWAIKSGMVRGVYDSSIPDDESDTDRNPMDVVYELLGGDWAPGPVSWEARKGALITALNKHTAPGVAALNIDPVDAKPLVQALSGRWYYPQNRLGGVSKDLPAKPNHPWEDLGDAFVNWICAAVPGAAVGKLAPARVDTTFDSRFYGQQPVATIVTNYDPR